MNLSKICYPTNLEKKLVALNKEGIKIFSEYANNPKRKPNYCPTTPIGNFFGTHALNMMVRDVIEENKVIASTILLNPSKASVLTNLEITKSFMSMTFTSKSRIKNLSLEESRVVTNIDSLEMIHIDRICMLRLAYRDSRSTIWPPNLLILTIRAWPILEMVWLTIYWMLRSMIVRVVWPKVSKDKKIIIYDKKQAKK